MKNRLIQIGLSLILSLAFPLVSSAEPILDEIKKTGVLRAGVRQDAAPLGYLTPGEKKWEGYCITLMELLATRLQTQLNLEQPIQLELVPSTLENREKIVREGTVHLECGPNTITRTPTPGIVYSDRFLITGTYLLVQPENQADINPRGALENITIGILPNSLTERFINGRYSLAEPIPYPGKSGRENAVKDVFDGKINAFASDGLLLVGEVLREENITLDDYALIPSEPLTCEFYGMILPAGDIAWLNTINSLILVEESLELVRQLYGSNSAYVTTTEAAVQKCTP